MKPDIKKFPLLKILSYKIQNTYFEIILVSLNDSLVKHYLENKISYQSIYKIMLKLLKKREFTKYYSINPRNIKDVKSMVQRINLYLENYDRYQEITNKMEELNTKLSIKENRWYELLKMEEDLVSA